jgi:hypothetical protein
MNKKLKDLTNIKYGKLLVLHRSPNIGKQTMWNCKCDCGNIGICYGTHLKSGATTSCGCNMKKSGSDHKDWTGNGEISGQRWNAIKRNGFSSRVSRNNIPFEITIDYAWRLFLEQNRKCNLTGLDIHFGKSNFDETTASLDRIECKKGYIEGNVQWLHKDVNRMKNIYDQDYFIKICKLIASGNCDII